MGCNFHALIIVLLSLFCCALAIDCLINRAVNRRQKQRIIELSPRLRREECRNLDWQEVFDRCFL